MSWRDRTVEVYNQSAAELAEYFRSMGPRETDIDLAIELAGSSEQPHIVEIGCGDGRDAQAIIKRTPHYIGFDISEELIEIARDYVPETEFEVADAVTFQYPEGTDVVIAFASLLHLDKGELKTVLEKVHTALKVGGTFMISLKLAEAYKQEVKTDRFGSRLFYFYNPELIQELAGDGYEVASSTSDFKAMNNTEWFEIVLRKI